MDMDPRTIRILATIEQDDDYQAHLELWRGPDAMEDMRGECERGEGDYRF